MPALNQVQAFNTRLSEKGNKSCASCENLPCVRYMKDPSISDEENAENLKIMLNNLKNSVK